MKKAYLIFLTYLFVAQVNGQNYDIDFEVSGQGTPPNSVQVTNLNTSESLLLQEDVLRLNLSTLNMNTFNLEVKNKLKVYPNPINEEATIEYSSQINEKTTVKIYDVFGKLVMSEMIQVEDGINILKLKGLRSGTYILTIASSINTHSSLLVSTFEGELNPSIEFIETKSMENLNMTKQSRNNRAIVDMEYTTGEELQFIAEWNGEQSTINLIPTQSQTLQFDFSLETVTDIDGNVYNTTTIGTQTWMTENLKVTHYANGTAIPNTTDNMDWANLGSNNTDKAFCYQNNNTNNEATTYGALYTYAAATNGDNSGNNVQGICPYGWHLPSDDEWKTLEMVLGMSQAESDDDNTWRGTNQGSQLSGTANLWNNGALEVDLSFGSSNFNAIASGARYDYNGAFVNTGIHSYLWTSTQSSFTSDAYARRIDYNATTVFRAAHAKSYGICVRCIKN